MFGNYVVEGLQCPACGSTTDLITPDVRVQHEASIMPPFSEREPSELWLTGYEIRVACMGCGARIERLTVLADNVRVEEHDGKHVLVVEPIQRPKSHWRMLANQGDWSP